MRERTRTCAPFIKLREKSGRHEGLGPKAALFLVMACLGPASAWEGAAVRNCTWCHGTSGQGYTVAPRLSGQRPAYLETQIRSFRNHTRDNPFSKQYMWGAVAALDPRAVRDLAAYFASIAPQPANDGDPRLVGRRQGHLHGTVFPRPTSHLATHVTVRTPRVSAIFHASAALPISTSKRVLSSGVRAIIRVWEHRCPSSRALLVRMKSRHWRPISVSSGRLRYILCWRDAGFTTHIRGLEKS